MSREEHDCHILKTLLPTADKRYLNDKWKAYQKKHESKSED